ncbi:MAG: FG-GAP-like repeat-containing protein [Bryobacterales bacterium]
MTGDGLPDVLFSFVGFNHPHQTYLTEAPLPSAGALEDSADAVFAHDRVRLVGDVDGDGLPDLAGPSLEGIEFWSADGLDPSAPTAVLEQTNRPELSEVYEAGDLDGDGFGDVVVVDRVEAKSYLYLGPIEGTARPQRQLERYGDGVRGFEAAAAVPDIDGDGTSELLLSRAQDGNYDQTGLVWLVGIP